MSRPGRLPGLHGDQSLPETCAVLCPPGTRPFRGPFFARTANVAPAGQRSPRKLTLPAQSTSLVKFSTDKPKEAIELSYTATNWLITPDKGLLVTLRVPGEKSR
jgi:hypothetical protein